MKLLLLLFSLLLTLSAPRPRVGKDTGPASRSRRTAAPSPMLAPMPKLGRCSGDAYCTACSSCEYCGHCAGGGGTCGVCSSSTPARRVSRPVRSSGYRITGSGFRSGGSSAGGSRRVVPKVEQQLVEGQAYFVAAATLNLRAEPSADAEVVRVLERNDIVTVLELTDEKWAQVRVTTDEGDVEGYVARMYLAESESH